MLPLRENEAFSLTEFGTLAQGIEDYSSDDVFRPVRDDVPGLKLSNGELNLPDIKQIVQHVKSETS